MTLQKIAGWTADTGGCAWYRIETPVRTLEIPDTYLGTVMPNTIMDEPDRLVVLQRSTTPVALMALDEFTRKGRPWVYDIDDLLWAIEPHNPAYSAFAGAGVRQRMQWLVSNTPLLTVSTPELGAEAREYGAKHIAVVPNTIPDPLFHPPATQRPDDGRKIIFWRGSNTHAEDIKVLAYGLRKIAKRDDVRIVLAGHDHRKALRIPDAEFLPWVKSPEAYIEQIIELQPDIALCPLTHNRFNHSKSHVNPLEASLAGAVPVCSQVPSYERFIKGADDPAGVLVPYVADHWYKAIRGLLDDDLLSMKRNARENALRYRSSLMKDQYRDLLESLTPDHAVA